MFEPEASIELLETESVFERLVAALLASGSVEEGAPAGEPGAPSAEPPVDEPPVDEPPAGEPPVDAPAFGDEPPVDASEAGEQYAAPGVTGQGPRPEQVSPDVVAVQQAVEALRRRAPSGRPGDVSALLALRNSLDGLVLAELAEMELTGAQLAVGAVTAATWLRDDQRISDVSARAQVRLGAALAARAPRCPQVLVGAQPRREAGPLGDDHDRDRTGEQDDVDPAHGATDSIRDVNLNFTQDRLTNAAAVRLNPLKAPPPDCR